MRGRNRSAILGAYQGLQTLAGGRTISELFEELELTIASESYLEASYKEMNLDSDRELKRRSG